MNVTYIIGNGFDLAHQLPTNYKENFKTITEKNESVREFWELYSFFRHEDNRRRRSKHSRHL